MATAKKKDGTGKNKGDKQKAGTKKSGTKAAEKNGGTARPCVPPEICAYLGELKVWLEWFYEDYKALRIAMCNVEQEAFTGTGSPGKRFPPCGGGPGGDVTPPPRPPVWE